MNPIVVENQLAGTDPTVWDIPDTGGDTFKYGDQAILGYAVPFSVNLGQPVTFKIKLTFSPIPTPIPYHIDIYRLGYYGGKGARKITTIIQPTSAFSQIQPDCPFDSATGLIDCGNWNASAAWTPTAPLISGVYLARLVREDDPSKGSHIVFVVREDSRASDILVKTSDTTWHAYNCYVDPANAANKKKSLYGDGTGNYPDGRAYKVSYNRPFDTRSRPSYFGAPNFLFSDEYPMHRWLEANGYDVTYCAGIDVDESVPNGHQVFMSVGHDEYWSKAERDHVEAARANGMHLAFFSGNECFWKIRWESDTNAAKRTLVCYKETFSGAKIDPTNIWTGTWRDPLGASYDAGKPENELTGTLFTVNGMTYDNISVPAQHRRMRLWRFTPISELPPSDPPAVLANYSLGFEWDEDLDNGFRPSWPVACSSSTYQVTDKHLQDPTPGQNNGDSGTNFTSGSATHSLMFYKHASGALVFGAGTTRWSWGLDVAHDAGDIPGAAPTTDVNIRQATVNLLFDMGVVPATPQGGLVTGPAAAVTDPQAPVTVITSPSDGDSVAQGSNVLIAGSATASAGVVGGVEVSVDGGTKWHPAQPADGSMGLENWVYSWVPTATGAVTIEARAVDDSANQESPGASIGVTVTEGSTSLWDVLPAPTIVTVDDANPVELGLKFQSSVAGNITGLRFYKGPQNTGTHVGNLWDGDGNNLATVTFSGETASGWQTMNFPSPVPIEADTMYIVSYHTNGFYSVDRNYFVGAFTHGALTALASGSSGGNCVFLYGAGGFPQNTYEATNYWVDVLLG